MIVTKKERKKAKGGKRRRKWWVLNVGRNKGERAVWGSDLWGRASPQSTDKKA